MKLDELEKMARQTAVYGVHSSGEYIYSFYTEQLQAFARLIAEHEREACADLCKEMYLSGDMDTGLAEEAIRARGQA